VFAFNLFSQSLQDRTGKERSSKGSSKKSSWRANKAAQFKKKVKKCCINLMVF
jgi:hypothetical protein